MAVNLRIVSRFTHGVIAPDKETANKQKNDQRCNHPLGLGMRTEESHGACVLNGAALFARPAFLARFRAFFRPLNFRADWLVHSFFFLVRRNLNRISHFIFLPGMLASAAPPRPERAPAKAWLRCSDIELEYDFHLRRRLLPAPALLQGFRKLRLYSGPALPSIARLQAQFADWPRLPDRQKPSRPIAQSGFHTPRGPANFPVENVPAAARLLPDPHQLLLFHPERSVYAVR